jgi:hypothetical protein
MTAEWAEESSFPTETEDGINHVPLLQGIASCDHCGRTSMGITDQPPYSHSSDKDRFEWTDDENLVWFPATGASPQFPDVPVHIATAAKEAHSSASIGSVMTPILMARTVVEATAKEKGITSGFLVAKIDALATAGFIRNDTKDAAHEIRHFGNDMAHGDIQDLPTANDVEEVLALMDEVLNEVFQGPARTARIKAKRTGAP